MTVYVQKPFRPIVLSVAGAKPSSSGLLAEMCQMICENRGSFEGVLDLKAALLEKLSEAQLLRPGAWFFFWNCVWNGFIEVREIVDRFEQFIIEKYSSLNGVFQLNVISGVAWFIRLIKRPEAVSALKFCDVLSSIIAPYFADLKKQPFLPGTIESALKDDDIDTISNIREIPAKMNVTPLDFYLSPCVHPTSIQLAALYGSVDCFKYLLINDKNKDEAATTTNEHTRWKPRKMEECINVESSDEEEDIVWTDKLIKWWKEFQETPFAIVTLDDFCAAGGNPEIIRALHENGSELLKSLRVAILYHNNSIFDWVANSCRFLSPLVESLYEAAIISNNLYVFKYLVGNYWSLPSLKSVSKYHRLEMLKFAAATMSVENLNVMMELAISNNDVAGFRFLLNLNFDEFRISLGNTGLMNATVNGACDIVREILSIDVIEISSMASGTPLLTWAMRNNQKQIFNLLLADKRIDPNVCKDKSPLHTAIETHKIHYVEALLSIPRVDVNQMCYLSNNTGTPFHFAIRCGGEIFELVNKSPNVDRSVTLPDGSNALHVALLAKQESVFLKLVKYPEISRKQRTTSGWTILHAAVDSITLQAIAYIGKNLTNEVDVNAVSDTGSALAFSVKSFDAFKELIKCQSLNVNIPMEDKSFFNWLIMNERGPWCSFILSHPSFDCNYRGEDMVPSLSTAIMMGERKTLLLLVTDHKPDPNQQDKDGNTPLHTAAMKVDIDLVQTVMKCPNIDFRKQNSCLNTALHVCAYGSTSLEMKFFNQYGYSADAWLRIFKKLVQADPYPLNIQNANGETPLHIAFTCHGQFNCCFLTVLPISIQYDLCDDKGENLFHLAARCGCVELIREIMKKYPQLLNSRTKNGETALHYAASRGKIDFISQLLLIDDVDPNPVNNQGKTPLDFAPPQMKAELSRYFPIEI